MAQAHLGIWWDEWITLPTQHFQFKHFQNSKIDSESRFLKRDYIITNLKKKYRGFDQYRKMDFPLYFKILLGQWELVILEIQYELLRVFSLFLSKKSRQGG